MKRWMSIGTVLMVASVLVRGAETNNAAGLLRIGADTLRPAFGDKSVSAG
jgi:hypothetical protein